MAGYDYLGRADQELRRCRITSRIEFVSALILHLHRPRGNVVGMVFPQRRIGHHVFVQIGDDEPRRALTAEQVGQRVTEFEGRVTYGFTKVD